MRLGRRSFAIKCAIPLVLLCLLCCLQLSCFADLPRFQEGKLPADLPKYLGQLDTLHIPSTVEKLDWLPPTLKELDASYTKFKSIPQLPAALEKLNLHGAKDLVELPALPSSLRELNISSTSLRAASLRLPAGLVSLTLGGSEVRDLDGLRESAVLGLTLEGVQSLVSVTGLPKSLRHLSISDGVVELEDLPRQLSELRLKNTRVKSLRGLPESLQFIALQGNADLDIEEVEFPSSLLSLSVDRLPPLQSHVFLNNLELINPSPLAALPPMLRELTVPVSSMLRGVAVGISSVRKLVVSGEVIPENENAPVDLRSIFPSLEELSFVVYESPYRTLADLRTQPLTSLDVSGTKVEIEALPSHLRRLTYRFCELSAIANLPASLRSLNIEGSIGVTALEELPPLLESLDISETSIAELPALPSTIVELDLSHSRVKTLKGLEGLPHLRKLTLHATQLRSLKGLPPSVRELRFVDLLPMEAKP